MAILKSVVDVNNGNTGWTYSDVMDSLETVFANLGFHGGSSSSGVPQGSYSPNGSIGFHESWRACGGGAVYRSPRTDKYEAISNGTSAYRMLKIYSGESGAYSFYDDTNAGDLASSIKLTEHGLTTGQAIHWAKGGTNEDYNVNGLTLDTIYYVIVISDDFIRLAANATDASNGTYITLSYGGWSSGKAAKSNTVYSFTDFDDACCLCGDDCSNDCYLV